MFCFIDLIPLSFLLSPLRFIIVFALLFYSLAWLCFDSYSFLTLYVLLLLFCLYVLPCVWLVCPYVQLILPLCLVVGLILLF